ncbi:GvpL/GvpF family gas vesicle protein [Streptomyces sp. NPDC093546]|uniref:GvpL/GvpF family gas vesicle protein n=1 Tax=Streptomyces sp. NPDC093546 TaxID=3366040 RepID=UPI0037FEB276
MSATVDYLYAIAAATTELREAVAALRGVGDAPVRVVTDRDVAAVVSDVPSADFEEAPLTAHLEDLGWLETVARAHHGVIDAVAARTAVLPLRLATIYRDDDGVRTMLAAGRDDFLPRLARLAGHVEWGVKVFFAPDPATDPGTGTAAAPPAPELSPGRAYLRHRRQERRTRDTAYQEALEAAQRIHVAARGRAVEHTRHRAQQGALVEGPFENIANDAYLVPSDRSEPFLAAVRQAAEGEDTVQLEITGPWAPYSFAAAAPAPENQEGEEATAG